MEVVQAGPRTIQGTIRLDRTGSLAFPQYELTADGSLVAGLARNSFVWVFLGPGRRVRLADGAEWRIKTATSGRFLVPVVKSDRGTVAFAGPLHAKRSYGITGKDFAYDVVPQSRGGWRGAGLWALRRHDTDVALIHSHRRLIDTAEPIPTAAALLAFTVLSHGVPGETALMPTRD